eukprot:COSAG01_NODE_4386_length_5078_cov_16.813818_1_plen_259_part_00
MSHRARCRLSTVRSNQLSQRLLGQNTVLGLAVFSLSNERAGPKDRKYDPSRSHYKKVSLLRDRLIPAVGSSPTIIFIPPSWRGPLGSRRPKKAIAFFGGCFLVGAPFGPRESVAWVPALGLSAVVGSCLLRTYQAQRLLLAMQTVFVALGAVESHRELDLLENFQSTCGDLIPRRFANVEAFLETTDGRQIPPPAVHRRPRRRWAVPTRPAPPPARWIRRLPRRRAPLPLPPPSPRRPHTSAHPHRTVPAPPTPQRPA